MAMCQLQLYIWVLGLIAVVSAADPVSWGYDLEYGPSTWSNFNPQCGGTKQSPININNSKAVHTHYKPFQFLSYDVMCEERLVINNGHTVIVQVTLPGGKKPEVVGGGLPGRFVFSQYHFHWGRNSKEGSEHTVDGNSYPLELHMVLLNTKYKTINDAEKCADGLAVLSILYKEAKFGTKATEEIASALEKVPSPGTRDVLSAGEPLFSLLPRDRDSFYRYQGSLTTPPCSESVTWTIFTETRPITIQQMQKIRQVAMGTRNSSSINARNFRYTMPMNKRKLYYVKAAGVSSWGHSSPFSALLLAISSTIVGKLV